MLATRYRLPDRREHASVRGDMVVVTEVISMGSDRSLGPLAAAWVARLEVLFDNFEKSATRSPAGAFSTGVNQITERVKHGRKLNMMIEMNDQSLRSTGGGGSTVNGSGHDSATAGRYGAVSSRRLGSVPSCLPRRKCARLSGRGQIRQLRQPGPAVTG